MPFVRNDTSKENRRLSQMPSFKDENGNLNLNFTSEFETYISEHFAFREKLVTADSLIKNDIFRTSSNEKVIVGKNNWLYYATTIDDYTGRSIMSPRRIANTAKTLSLMQEYTRSKGSEFVFISAPNKNTVFPENMPSRYIKSDEKSNLELINSKLDEYCVNNINLKELFDSQGKILYHTRDSHWTNEGALLVYNAVMDRFALKHDDYSNTPSHSENIWSADLDTMLFPSLEILSEQTVYNIDYTFTYTCNFRSSDDTLISTVCDGKNNKILMYRDSFGRSLYPFFAENSAEAEFSREIPYRLDLLDGLEPNLTILEIVERNLPDLTEKAPFMEAPSRSIDISASIDESPVNLCFSEDKNGLRHLYGQLDSRYFNTGSEIYITLENDENIICYEAFPIYEAELLGDENQSDYGFSLYINPDTVPHGQYSVNAYIKNNSEFICTDKITDAEF